MSTRAAISDMLLDHRTRSQPELAFQRRGERTNRVKRKHIEKEQIRSDEETKEED